MLALGAGRIEGAGEFAQQGAGGHAERARQRVELFLARQLFALQPGADGGDAGAWNRGGDVGGG